LTFGKIIACGLAIKSDNTAMLSEVFSQHFIGVLEELKLKRGQVSQALRNNYRNIVIQTSDPL
jgi:hypothetical protein